MNESLYSNVHQLNREEAYRRLNYWLDHFSDPRAHAALKLLVSTLERDDSERYDRTRPCG